jgi:hypothetical protein
MQANFPFNSSIEVDRYYDGIPFVSTLTNLYIIFQKCVLIPVAEAKTSCLDNHYFTYLEEKSLLRCIVLLLPILGNLIVYLYDCQYPDDGQEFAKAVLRKDGTALKYATPDGQNEKEMTTLALQSNADAFQYASPTIRGDRDFVLSLLKPGGQKAWMATIFPHITEELKKDRELVLKLVTCDCLKLESLDESFRDDPEIVSAAYGGLGYSLQYASERLRNDRDFVRKKLGLGGYTFFHYAGEKLKNDKAFVLELINSHRLLQGVYQYASAELRDDEEVARAALTYSGHLLPWAGNKVRNNKALVLLAIENTNGDAFDYASKNLKSDPEVIKAAKVKRSS